MYSCRTTHTPPIRRITSMLCHAMPCREDTPMQTTPYIPLIPRNNLARTTPIARHARPRTRPVLMRTVVVMVMRPRRHGHVACAARGQRRRGRAMAVSVVSVAVAVMVVVVRARSRDGFLVVVVFFFSAGGAETHGGGCGGCCCGGRWEW